MKQTRQEDDSAQRGSIPLHREVETPLYQQIVRLLTHEITTGHAAPGTPIGTEPELMKRFEVSRVTLRHALDLLVQDQLIVRKQGKGTFVREVSLDIPLGPLAGTTQVARGAGHQVHSRVYDLASVMGPTDTRAALGVARGELLTRFWRVDFENDQPLAAALIFVPASVGSDLTVEQLEDEPLYPLLEQTHNIAAMSAEQTIETTTADSTVALRLQVPEGAAVSVVSRLTRDQQGAPFESSNMYFRANSVRFTVSLRRGSGAGLTFPVNFAAVLDGDRHRTSPPLPASPADLTGSDSDRAAAHHNEATLNGGLGAEKYEHSL